MSFLQDAPQLGNQYETDSPFQELLERYLPQDLLSELAPGLRHLGERVVTDIRDMGESAESNPPRLVQYDSWGKRVDRIEVDAGWESLAAVAAEEGLISLPHTKPHGEWSRLVQGAKLYLFHPSSMIYTCPVAMSDGAACLLERYASDEIKQHALTRLLSNDPAIAWTSGQWMTETSGGSDVSRTETVARKEGDHYRLYGTKFYTSATTSQMAIALARIEDASGNTIAGSRGLSTFYLEVHDEAGQLNNMSIRRLKDKMGSKALPTAEITLEGTTAQLVGEPGAGVRQISSLFNMTRIQNGIAAVSSMRRMVAFVRDYAERREAFGRRLIDLPLYAQGVAQMETEVQGGLQLVFYLVSLLGKEESGKIAADEQAILRILMPLAKLYTAKQGIDVAAEGIEAIGAAAYMEDTGLPRLYREAVALAIWEGATNVCCLDAMRAIVREGALEPFLADVARRGEAIQLEDLVEERSAVLAGVGLCRSYIEKALGAGPETGEAAAREIAFGLTNLAIAALLLEHAQWASRNENANSHRCTAAARRWCRKPLYPQIVVDDRQRDETALLARSGEGVASIQSANERVNIEPPRIRSQPTEQREVG